MIDVLDKNKYLSDNASFAWTVAFPNLSLTYTNSGIVKESFRLTESLCDNDSLEFVGCIASCCQISLYDVQYDLKGQRMTVMIDDCPMFDGIVDSVEIQTPSLIKKITAYDKLYSISDVDVASWYQGLTFPKTLKQIRDSLLTYLGLTWESADLPADDVSVAKEYEPRTLNGLVCLKAICQINGCCGIINRYGRFEFRYVTSACAGLYPSIWTFPGATTFPSGQTTENKYLLGYYEQMKYQEYYVNPVTKVQIRPSEDEIGVTEGNGDNKYIIQANMWARNLSVLVLHSVASGILNKLKDVTFHPCNIKGDGLPFLEVGDVIEYPVNLDNVSQEGGYNASVFLIMSRTFTGTQFLRDTFTARGEENQSLFITDLQTQIDTIKQNGGGGGDMSKYYTKAEMDEILSTDYYTQAETIDEVSEQVNQLETPTGFTIQSVYTLPTVRNADTVYLIQGGVIIL
jgi:hypothetical protein